ncbi:MAG: shikimate dehydrogenase [Desulfobacterales bacterium]
MQVYCILGDERVMRSKSPIIFSTVLKRIGLKGIYVPFSIDPCRIGSALQSIRVLNIAGASITIPFKEKVIPHLDVLSEGANIIGAINTIVRNGDILKGYNTNAIGFMDALNDSGFEVEGKSALVFGTGGAARAIVFILNWLRTGSIYVVGRDREKTLQIVNRFGGEALPIHDLEDRTLDVDIVVNATSVSSPDESSDMAVVLEKLRIKNCELVVDLNYGRNENLWQSLAQRMGSRFMDGLSPLAYQCRRTLALWTGIQVPPEEFLKALDENL